MHIAFIVPAPFTTISGGYEYDRRIVTSLRATGHEVGIHELAGQHPLADNAARESAQAIWASLDRHAAIVIDGLGLPSFAGLESAFAERGVVVLNHHPLGLETGLDAATSITLTEIERSLTQQARHVITTSTTTEKTIISLFGIAPERITVIEPGTEDAPRSTGSGTGRINVLSIGSLIPRKGHDVLMQAMAQLFDLDWHLTIAGSAGHDPVHAQMLMALPASLGITDRVTFPGAMSGVPLADLWLHADVFALATYYEGYGMVIAEALKRGLPVAVCGGGAAGQLLTPESGVVCPPGDVVQLSKALRRLIFDGPLRQSMADAAWLSGQTLPDWNTQAATFATLLQPGPTE